MGELGVEGWGMRACRGFRVQGLGFRQDPQALVVPERKGVRGCGSFVGEGYLQRIGRANAKRAVNPRMELVWMRRRQDEARTVEARPNVGKS